MHAAGNSHCIHNQVGNWVMAALKACTCGAHARAAVLLLVQHVRSHHTALIKGQGHTTTGDAVMKVTNAQHIRGGTHSPL